MLAPSLLRPLAAVLLAGAAAHAGDPTYQFVDLGTLGGPESRAFGLNDSRQVVGWSYIPGCTVNGVPCRRAFLWDSGTMIDLGLLAGDEESTARAINASGLIVGTSERDIIAGSGTFHGFSYDGSMTPLDDLGQGQSFAHDVNDAGTIVGHTQDPSNFRDRTVTWQSGTITNVGDTESHSYNRGYGISEGGVVVGWGWNLFQPNDAILHAGGNWFTIGGTDGPFQNAEAFDVNNAGQAVGSQAFPSGGWHAAIWTFGTPGATDLGLLPGMTLGALADINESGRAVGCSFTDFFPILSRAVVTDGTTLTDLNDLLPPDVDALLWDAAEINEHGDIVGTALIDGKFHAYLMVAEDEPTWSDLGNALAGVHGDPTLDGSGSLLGGTPITLSLGNAASNTTAFLVVGLSELNASFKGGVLVPALDLPGFPIALPTGPLGAISLNTHWPADLPSDLTTYYQAWIQDAAGPAGFAATNGLSGTTP